MMTLINSSYLRFLQLTIAAVLSCAMAGCTGLNKTDVSEGDSGITQTTAQAQQTQLAHDAQKPSQRDLSLTVYSSADPAGFDPQVFIARQRQGAQEFSVWAVPGFGVVRDVRTLDLKQGTSTLSFTDVAQFIDPTTVSLVDITRPALATDATGVSVLQQKFAFDLVSPQKLLDSYIDRDITLNQNLGKGNIRAITGKLLSSNQGRIILQTDTGIRVLNWSNDIKLGALPGQLMTRPTLQWDIFAPQAGERKVRTAYQTAGLTWRADYNLLLNNNDTRADLSAWVTLLNLSGISYPDTQLKLIAGDVQILSLPIDDEPMFELSSVLEADEYATTGFVEKPFFEYHMYTLPRRVSIDQNTTQQLVLFPPVDEVKIEKLLIYHALPDTTSFFHNESLDSTLFVDPEYNKLEVYLKFDNKEANKLGLPLPRGKVRAFKKNGDALEFVGEGLIDHTAKNQEVLINLGQSFDVTGERTQVNVAFNDDQQNITETMKITLTSARNKPAKVIIQENLNRWTAWHGLSWEVTASSDEYEKIDAKTIHFTVIVPPGGQKVVTYTLRFNFKWK